MKLLQCSIACAALVASAHGQAPTETDVWDTFQGAVITGGSDIAAGNGGLGAALGENGHDIFDSFAWTYFADGQPANFVHYLEWETPADVTVNQVRIFGFGENFNELGQEFDQVVIKAKSPGSDTYDLTVLVASPAVFTAIDWESWLVIDEVVPAVTARSFRAEFVTSGSYGPHIFEIDGLGASAPPPPPPVPDVPTSGTDAWDISQGAVMTATSGINVPAGSLAGMFGENGQFNGLGSTWTYFIDAQPEGFVHFVEWQTPAAVTIGEVRVFAIGDADLNNGREFAQMTIKAKSPGSSTYDLTLLTFAPATHPYAFIDPVSWLILDQTITPVTARYFRAEFLQYNAGNGWDGPRIVEIDGIATNTPPPPPPPPALPVIVAGPDSVTGNIYMPTALSVEATGTGALRYQWFKNGTAMEGQTSSFVMIPSLTASDAATYHVTVTDDVGTVTSSGATVSLDYVNMLPADFDVWDVRMGASPSASSPIVAGSSLDGMFGGDVTEFANQGPSAVHFVEWTVPAATLVKTVRLFAHGDGLSSANLHEFGSFTLKAKSPGSATFDIVVGVFTPAHPYPLLDANTFAILDTEIAPVMASAFRAEFTQYSGGPRVLELDAFATRPLVLPGIVCAPKSQVAPKNGDVTLSVLAKGGALQYQWKFNGKNIAGATTDKLTIVRVQKRDQGNYSVVVSNELGSVESAPAKVDPWK